MDIQLIRPPGRLRGDIAVLPGAQKDEARCRQWRPSMQSLKVVENLYLSLKLRRCGRACAIRNVDRELPILRRRQILDE
jgi:hypothetical protein